MPDKQPQNIFEAIEQGKKEHAESLETATRQSIADAAFMAGFMISRDGFNAQGISRGYAPIKYDENVKGTHTPYNYHGILENMSRHDDVMDLKHDAVRDIVKEFKKLNAYLQMKQIQESMDEFEKNQEQKKTPLDALVTYQEDLKGKDTDGKEE